MTGMHLSDKPGQAAGKRAFRLVATIVALGVALHAVNAELPGCAAGQERRSGQDESAPGEDLDSAEALNRGVTFLADEVPAWNVDHDCFSCHNNSNAAQALYRAKASSFAASLEREIPDRALRDTTEWLHAPEKWKDNGGDPAFADETLANIQFAAALATAIECGQADDAERDESFTALRAAGKMIAEDQLAEGYWRIGDRAIIGTPATLGNLLATREAVRGLRVADDAAFADSINTAETWLLGQRPERVFDAAALLLAMADLRAAENNASDPNAKAGAKGNQVSVQSESEPLMREALINQTAGHALSVVRGGQSPNGGFGPYRISPPEPFDTAVAIIALCRWGDSEDRHRIATARDFLVQQQFEEGFWKETTRPAGNESYAQRISTAGWAVLALLEAEEHAAAGQSDGQ